MSATTATKLPELSPAQMVALYAQFKANEAAEKVARKAQNVLHVAHLATIVPDVAASFDSRTFDNGAVGWHLGGTVKIDGRDARVSFLIRYVDTIPAPKPKVTNDAAAIVADDETAEIDEAGE